VAVASHYTHCGGTYAPGDIIILSKLSDACLAREGWKRYQHGYCSWDCEKEYERNGNVSRGEHQRRQQEQRRQEEERLALPASGLEPLFQKLGLGTDAQTLQLAIRWLKLQGANTLADLNHLPAGTYTCKELADSLGLPVVQAQWLLTELEGTKLFHSKPPPGIVHTHIPL
jgi:hypothetical protein